MLVSIIIPNYNHSKFLEQRINSVLHQKYQDFEVILLDDASVDESRSIIEHYKDHPKVSHVIYNVENSGSPFKQWAKGIALAKGEWIWIAESDDYSDPEFLRVMMEGVAITHKCSMACCHSYIVTPEKGVIASSKNTAIEDRQMAGKRFIKEQLLHSNNLFNAGMVIFKREAAIEVPNHYTDFSFCGDWLFWIYLAQKGNIFCSCRRLNYYRQHTGNQSAKMLLTGQHLIEELKVFHKLKEESLMNRKETRRMMTKQYLLFLKKRHLFSEETKLSILAAFLFLFQNKLKFYLFRIQIHILYMQVRAIKRYGKHLPKKPPSNRTRISVNAGL